MKGKRATLAAKSAAAKATPALIREYDDDIVMKAVRSEKKIKMNVKFDDDDVEMFEYGEHDFVSRSSRKPKGVCQRFRTVQKRSLTCQATQEIMNDPQCVLQSKLGMTRARAIGILMDDFGEFADVDEVHIVLGPRSDIKFKFN